MTESKKDAFLHVLEHMWQELRLLHEENVIDDEIRRIARMTDDQVRGEHLARQREKAMRLNDSNVVAGPAAVLPLSRPKRPTIEPSSGEVDVPQRASSYERRTPLATAWHRLSSRRMTEVRLGDCVCRPRARKKAVLRTTAAEGPSDAILAQDDGWIAEIPLKALEDQRAAWTRGIAIIKALRDHAKPDGVRIDIVIRLNKDFKEPPETAIPLHLTLLDAIGVPVWEGTLSPNRPLSEELCFPGVTTSDVRHWRCRHGFE